jgi:glycyl-tRNA synthetase beta chain
MNDYEISVSLRQILVVVGVEDIPSHDVRAIATAFGERLQEELTALRIPIHHLRTMATPRRLVVTAQAGIEQEPLHEQIRGPLLANAYNDGIPTPALMGFCRRLSISPGELETMGEGERTYVCAFVDKPVAQLETLLSDAVERAFGQIPLTRTMRWGEGDFRFIRPVRWCSLWVDDALQPLQIAGVRARAETYGNRTDHPGALRISGIGSYEQALAKGFVVLDPLRREQLIVGEAAELAESVGGTISPDPELLEEVVHLVEWPMPFLGKFDLEFLAVPAPVLVTTMKVHQRYFSIVDAQGALLPYFIGVRNGIGNGMDLVVHGNEKVLRARLSDALYFYEADLRHHLEDYQPRLSQVVFHAAMGTYGDKIERVHRLFEGTQDHWALTAAQQMDFSRAVDLYKTDLLTYVVQEFPELQGVMGGIYAARQGESPAVAEAIGEQYHPGSQGDRLPSGKVGQLLVLLDRLDTVLRGIDNGLKPTGSEDPFGMRRSALAIGRILKETDLWNAPAFALFARAGRILEVQDASIRDAYELVMARLGRYLEGELAIPVPRSQAVLKADSPWFTFDGRLAVLSQAQGDPGWEKMAQAFKRIDRVLGKALPTGRLTPCALPVEERVREQIEAAGNALTPAGWLDALRQLSESIDALFEAVLVNDPDPEVKAARMLLLGHARLCYNRYFVMSQT